jgi:hypothetical protein
MLGMEGSFLKGSGVVLASLKRDCRNRRDGEETDNYQYKNVYCLSHILIKSRIMAGKSNTLCSVLEKFNICTPVKSPASYKWRVF